MREKRGREVLIHQWCLVAIVLEPDDDDYEEFGDKGMCRNCHTKYVTARSRALQIIARHEDGVYGSRAL